MPLNMYDTAASKEQHETFLRNPDDPKGKPYSTKQEAANAAHKRLVTLYHKTHGTRAFNREDEEMARADGWVDTPYVHPNNPDHQSPEVVEDNEVEILHKELTDMGRKFDKRWGKERLRQELSKPDG